MLRTMTRAVLLTPAVATAGVLLIGCSANSDPGGGPAAATAPSATRTATPVDDASLGRALDLLVLHTADRSSTDGGSCFVRAVHSSGLSDAALARIAAAGSDDLAGLAAGMAKDLPADSAVLISPQLRGALDGCRAQVTDAVAADPAVGASQTYAPPRPIQRPASDRTPDLRPKHEIRETSRITSANQLTDGLASTFTSFATDEKQRALLTAAGPCFSDAVWSARFSQETLRFLAGGAPIGTGSIAEHLPNDQDRRTWESAQFSMSLSACVAKAQPRDPGGG